MTPKDLFMEKIVIKFGGSSLASAEQIQKAAAIIRRHTESCYVVASAPGKRFPEDSKVTDLLYQAYDEAANGKDFAATFAKIRARFDDIVRELGIGLSLDADYAEIENRLRTARERDFMASRGEYLNSKILAAYLGYPFVDPARAVVFRENGRLDAEKTDVRLRDALAGLTFAVIPGFYGARPDGTVQTFSRGGSDVTGSLVAKAVRAKVYENWTDVSGMKSADPRIVPNPRTIRVISFKELRELSYMGATVLHEDAVFPVREAGIPINVRNTNAPDEPGTIIVAESPADTADAPITGIAGRKGFATIYIEKNMMNQEIGFGRKCLSVLEDANVSFEHMPSGIDTLSIIINAAEFNAHRDEVLNGIESAVHPDSISYENDLALIAVVGHGMMRKKGISARIFTALANAKVNIRMLNQGSSELNIIIGIEEADFETAIRAIYTAFYPA